MSESFQSNKELFDIQRRVIARLSRRIQGGGAFDDVIDPFAPDVHGRIPTRYEALARWRTEQSKLVAAKMLDDPVKTKGLETVLQRSCLTGLAEGAAILSGTSTMARILSFAPEAYAAYYQKSGMDVERMSASALRLILLNRRSLQETGIRLAGMGGTQNSFYEEWLHVSYDGSRTGRVSSICPFEIQSGDDENLPFLRVHPKYDAAIKVGEELRGLPLQNELACPAQKIALPILWPILVEDCVTSTHLFAQDFAQLQAAKEAIA